jgi:hypothetical protein
MTAPETVRQINQWLTALDTALAILPDPERADILTETRSHLHDRLAQGLSPEQALIGFGDARAYAQRFVDQFALNRALTSRKISIMARTLFGFAGRSVRAAVGLVFALGFAVFGISSLICMIEKAVRPDLVGLWLDLPLDAQHRYEHAETVHWPLKLGHDHIVFGFSNPSPPIPPFNEVLGPWIFPCLFLLTLLGFYAMRYSLMAAVRSMSGRGFGRNVAERYPQ